ncbi:MAG: hypothetical protein AAFO89_08970 [Planctomycetota bacterium]
MVFSLRQWIACLAVCTSGSVLAQLCVFEQLPSQQGAALSDASGIVPSQRLADNFSLSTTDTIGRVEFWGEYTTNNPESDSFTIDFYENTGGLPGTLLSSLSIESITREMTGQTFGILDEYLYSAQLPEAFTAVADESYFISITNDTNSGATNSWSWAYSIGGAPSAIIGALGDRSWRPFLGDGLSFRLITVPSPSTAALLGIAVLAQGRRRR